MIWHRSGLRVLRGAADRAGRGRLAPAEGGLRAVQQAVLRAFAATSLPPAPADLVSAAPPGSSVPDILAALAEADFLVLDALGRIRAAYPFSAAPTGHEVGLPSGRTVHAMCAIDALGIPPMLGTGAVITSHEPGSGEPVTVTVAGELEVWQPHTAVVRYAWRDCPGPAAATCCDLISFFTSRKAARVWTRGHPAANAAILNPAQASMLGAEIFGRLLHD